MALTGQFAPGQPLISVGISHIAPHQLTLSHHSWLGLWCGRRRMELSNPRRSACYNVPGCTSSKVQTLGLWHLQPPGVGVGSEPPYGARILHHGMDDLLVQQDPFVIDRPILLFRREPYTPSLWGAFFLNWSIWGNQVNCVCWVTPRQWVDLLDWLAEQLTL